MKPLWLSFSLWLILFAASAQKAPLAPNGGALVVGISHYKELDSLQFAHRDAAAFAQFLKTQNVPDDNIKLFLNEEASRFNIVDELYNLTQKLNKGDKFFFYFTGHGDLEAKIGYENSLLLLHGCYKKNYFQGTEYLQLSELRTWFGELTKKGVEVIFIADACHSGGLIGGKEGFNKTQKALQESWQGITKILSSQANEFSLEGKQWGGGRGIFSYFLVNGLTGRADSNKDKKVSLKELDNYLKTNVVREANPNTQTPVIQGNAKQMLSQSSEAGLKKLAEAERLSFPIITEANLKAADPMTAIGGLDNSLVETYNKFTKALAEKRLNTFDNEKDYALLHYRKLVAEKVPEHLLAIIKRNLGAGLLQRELDIMKRIREQYQVTFPRVRILEMAITNLNDAIKLLGEKHHIVKSLKARVFVLQSQKMELYDPNLSTDQYLDKIQAQKTNQILLLLQGLQLEPKMVSTYLQLGVAYLRNNQMDSSRYYNEKVLELIPNESTIHANMGLSYLNEPYTESDKIVPHPKAIFHLEKALQLSSNSKEYLRMLGNLYYGLLLDKYTDLEKAIPYYESHLKLVTNAHIEYKAGKYPYFYEGTYYYNLSHPSIGFRNFGTLISDHTRLFRIYKSTGDSTKANLHLIRFNQIVDSTSSTFSYMSAALLMYELATSDNRSMFNSYIHRSLTFQHQALKINEKAINTVPIDQKWEAQLINREILKAIGVSYRLLKNYSSAEKYLKLTIENPLELPKGLNLKFMGSISVKVDEISTLFSLPCGILKNSTNNYHYRLEAHEELFHLSLEQGKTDEAFEWLEKAFQQSVKENGNDISGKPFETSVFNAYPNLDQARFKALKAKYFPLPDTKK
jgi:tetratricopeptide (TPR) repeat protein